MDIGKLIEGAVQVRASDIHLMEGAPPYLRIDDALRPVEHAGMTHADMASVLRQVMPERLGAKLQEKRGVDFAYQHKDAVRCRVNAYYERLRLTIVLRLIPSVVPTIEGLELPPSLENLAELHRGLILVTGPAGCGKSTTLAALINLINDRRRVSIVTIEDPIEFVYANRLAIVSQREVGFDVEDFESGLIQALRQDPDVILVGEMRNLDTMRTAVRAAETGQLVLSTLHTASAVQTISRILGLFPQSDHPVVIEQLATTLRVIIAQELVRRIQARGRIAALEIMVVTDEVAKLIREGRVEDIYIVMKRREEDMQTLDQALAELVRANKISEDEARRYARDEHALHRYISGRPSSSDRGGVIG